MAGKREIPELLEDGKEGLMAKYLDIPDFASEEEEAAWWPQQEDVLFDAFEKAAAAGDLRQGTAAKTTGLFLVPAEDAALAREQADRKGLTVEAHLQSLLHKALLAEEQSKAS